MINDSGGIEHRPVRGHDGQAYHNNDVERGKAVANVVQPFVSGGAERAEEEEIVAAVARDAKLGEECQLYSVGGGLLGAHDDLFGVVAHVAYLQRG